MNKIVYYHDEKEYVIPLHLRQVNIMTSFNDATGIEINCVCKNREEIERWKELIDYLSPFSRRK